MTNNFLPPLPVRFNPQPLEGPRCYLMRLAHANGHDVHSLIKQGYEYGLHYLEFFDKQDAYDESVTRIKTHWEQQSGSWLKTTGRVCPSCLKSNTFANSVGWELRYCEACPTHECWLVDTCPCGETLKPYRNSIRHCSCGRDLSGITPVKAPFSVIALSLELIHRVSAAYFNQRGETSARIGDNAHVRLLTLENFQLLIEVIGTYGQPRILFKKAGRSAYEGMHHSWQITSVAAEACTDWPHGFRKLLDWLNGMNDDGLTPRLGHRFGDLYRHIYTTLKDAKFDFVRHRFEEYIDHKWPTVTFRRNSRWARAAASSYPRRTGIWITVEQASQRTTMSKNVIRRLVISGDIAGETRMTPSGRTRIAVDTFSLDRYCKEIRNDDYLTFSMVAQIVGLKKLRIRRIFKQLFPNAEKTPGLIWKVPAGDVSTLMDCSQHLVVRESLFDDEPYVSISSALKYHRLSDHGLVWLLRGIQSGAVPKPKFLLQRDIGIGAWVVERSLVETANNAADQNSATELQRSIKLPELAKRWAVKQEVIYRLANDGAFRLDSVSSAVYRGRLVSMDEVEKFEASYVAARDLAQQLATSSKWIIARLSDANIGPVFGPRLNGCRQMFYRRSRELDHAMVKFSKLLEWNPRKTASIDLQLEIEH